jgi:hypothetical protein
MYLFSYSLQSQHVSAVINGHHQVILVIQNIKVEVLFIQERIYLCMSMYQYSQNSFSDMQTGMFLLSSLLTNKQTNKLHGFSPQANYTDRVTAGCRQS